MAIAAIAGLSAHRYVTLDRELTDAALARRTSLAALAATTYSEKLDRLIDIGTALATRVRFQELIAEGRWSDAVQILRRVPEDFSFLDRVFVADPRGTLMADTPQLPGSRGVNFAHREWFKGVSREWKPYVSPLYRRTAPPQRDVIAVSVPIHGAGGNVTGILVLQVKLESYFDWAKQLDFGPDDRVMVVDGQGRVAFDSLAIASGSGAAAGTGGAPQVPLPRAAGADIVRAAGSDEDFLRVFAPAAHGWAVIVVQPARMAFAGRDVLLRQLIVDGALIALFAIAAIAFGTRMLQQRRREEADRAHRLEQERVQKELSRQAERLRIVHDIDRAIITSVEPEAIAAAVIEPLRELLGVPRAIVNLFDLAAGEVEWLAAAGRHRVRAGPGVRYSIRLMGDLEGLKRGEPQRIVVDALPPGPEVDALLASGVHVYMAVPMVAGGELIGALSFGGEQDSFPAEQVGIAQEVATQLAISIAHARLFERVKRQAEELERRVRERTAQLETANKELESFSYSVSHDLRSPLRAVDGYSLMLEEDYGARLDDEGRRLIGVIRASATRMAQLIDDLLEFSQVGRRALALALFDMRSLAGAVVADVAPGYPKARIDLAELPPAHGDRALLRQVWDNLIVNALKYSARKDAPTVEVAGKANGAEIVYSVRDNGAGFDMRYYDKLFKVFQRLHREDEFTGTGVGLAIVQRIVSRHGGRVWAEGRPGEGACFFFSLPTGN